MCSSIWHTDEGLELYCVGELPSPIHYSGECERYLLPTLVSSEVEKRDEKMEKVSHRETYREKREKVFIHVSEWVCTGIKHFVLHLYDVNICVSLSVAVLVTTNEAKVDMKGFSSIIWWLHCNFNKSGQLKLYAHWIFKDVTNDLLNPPGDALICSSECLNPELCYSSAKEDMSSSTLMFRNSIENTTTIWRVWKLLCIKSKK